MSPDNPDDPTDGGQPKCKAAFDAYDTAEKDFEDARDELHEAEFDDETQNEWMMMTCDNFGWESDPCRVELIAALATVHHLMDARKAFAAADTARYGASYSLIDCLSDHKFHGNVWLP